MTDVSINGNTTSGLRFLVVAIPWLIWAVACFLPAYALKIDVNETVNGWTCFIYGPGMIFGFEGWPWTLAWLANITMLVASIAHLISANIRFQRIISGYGAVLSLLVIGIGEGLLIAVFAWILANVLLWAGIAYTTRHKG
jgi:hypothetical protein